MCNFIKHIHLVSFSQPINALQCHSHGSGTRGDGNHCSLWTYTDLPTGASFSQVSMHLQLFPSPLRGWTSAFLLAIHRLCGAIEGRLSHLLPRWLKTCWRSVISQGKIPWNTPTYGWELSPGHGEDRQ